ncbi:hypothetical protein MRX96_042629 [Rhipicephalus microplus]
MLCTRRAVSCALARPRIWNRRGVAAASGVQSRLRATLAISMSRIPSIATATSALLFLFTTGLCELDAAATTPGVTTPSTTPGLSPKSSTRSTEYKNMDSHSLERTLSELRYGVELLVSKVTLLEPRLSRMDAAIGRLERALLREG